MKSGAEADIYGDDRNMRVLILTPQGRDAALAEKTLARNDIDVQVCENLEELRAEIARGAACALIAVEALLHRNADCAWLASEPTWSTLPLIVLLARVSSSDNLALLRRLERRPNVTFLERPVPKRTLISALRAAIEARRLQYAVRDAIESLQLANRKKDEFLATLAHELRNPLAPIRNAVEVFRRLKDDDPRAKDQKGMLISMMDRQIDHLVRLVDDLLEISRITTGKIALRKRPVALETALHQAMELSEPVIRSQEHKVSISSASEPLIVDGDPVRLAQIFANLLNNAAKYTPSGGHIQISSQRAGDQVVVSVRDNGVGILEDHMSEVFELFAQLHCDTGREQGGLGIGLALVRKLVELHGGNVEARSDGVGRGSEFIVRLPLSGAQPHDEGASDARSLPPSPRIGCWSSMTIGMSPTVSSFYCSRWARTSALLTTANRRSRSSRVSSLNWPSSTLECRAWTAMKRRASFASCPRDKISFSSP